MERQYQILNAAASSVTDDSSQPRRPDHDDDDEFNYFTRNGMMIKLGEEAMDYQSVKSSFLTGMKHNAMYTRVLAIHKTLDSSLAMKVRFNTFRNFEQAVLRKMGLGGGGDANIRYGWFGGSKEEISQIISYGFSRCNCQSHGVGVYFSPTGFLLDGFDYSSADGNGMRHMLLCHVLMGRMEVISDGSKQICPSSREFDSGIDSLEEPRRLVVWSAFMNSHIFPAYVISFKTPPSAVLLRNYRNALRINTRMNPAAVFPILVSVLGAAKADMVCKSFDDFRKHKISSAQLVLSVREVIGDNRLFVAIIKSFQTRVGLTPRPSRRNCKAEAAAGMRRRMV